MRPKYWTRVLMAGSAVLALALVGCSDDSSSGGGGGGGGTTDAGDDLTGEPIKVMVMGSFDAFNQDYTQIPEAAQAAADAIEAGGGVNGSPFEIIVCNIDDVNAASDCGRQAVSENVVATVGAFSTFGAEYLPILEDAGIPQVAVYPIAIEDLTSPINYPLIGGTISTTGGMGAQLADSGDDQIAVAYLDIEQGALAAQLVGIGSEPRGAEIIGEVPVPDMTVEYSPLVAQTLDFDPNGVAMVLASADAPGYLRALRQAGYDGDVVTSTTSIPTAALEELGPDAEGLLLPANFLPASYTGNDTVDQFNDELDQYAPSDINRDDNAQNAWAGIHLIATLMEGQNKITAQTLTQALTSADTIDVGFAPEFNFKQGIELPDLAPGLQLSIYNTSVVYSEWTDGEIQAIDGKFVNVLEG
jgi:ABC-type branched-subunit amino acid transport system substrate-binding protein